jgi:predicted negative regulator of RcsB-dependent stress response
LTRKDLKQDSFVEWTARATDFIQQYYVHLGVTILVLAVVIIGVSMYQKSQVSARESASFLLYQGQSLLFRGDVEAARYPLQECIDRFTGTPAGKQARLDLAHAFLATGENDAALSILEEGLLEISADDPLHQHLLQSKAATLMNMQEYDQAAGLYASMLSGEPDERERVEWTLRLADCRKQQGRLNEAATILQELQAEIERGNISQPVRDLESRLQVLQALSH